MNYISTPYKVIIAIPVLFLGGTEMQTLSLVRVLLSAGYKITICCYYEFDESMVGEMETAGANVIQMRLKRADGMWNLIQGLRALFKALQPDIVHVQYIAPGLAPIIAASLARVPVIFGTVHQPGRPYGWKEKVLLRTAARLSTGFFCVSKAAEESWFGDSSSWSPDAAKNGRKHFTIHNGVDCERIQRVVHEKVPVDLKTSLGLTDRPVVGVVGRLREEKGHAWLLKAMTNVVRMIPGATLLVVGDGPDRESLQKQAVNLGIASQVIWLGQKPPDELFGLYAAMDVVVVPSLFEGFGFSATEAMAAGLPVVGTRVDGLSEVIEHEVTGYLIPVGESHELARTVIQLLSNPEKSKEMGEKGRERVQELFSMQHFTHSTISAYQYFSIKK